jgi:hypothetical protein
MEAKTVCLSFWEDVELLDEKVLSRLLEEIKRSSKKIFYVSDVV